LFDSTVKTIVFNSKKQVAGEMLSFYQISKTEKIVPQILNALYSLQVQSVIIEGGATLLQSFIDENLWDEARVITNTAMKILAGINAPTFECVNLIKEEIYLTDKIAYFKNNDKQ
jgi:diaminohydroxyphosphoribosylaminopyrimidine deaminase/5-amino-6-(5-phosphoribosylamino)uracil reductase